MGVNWADKGQEDGTAQGSYPFDFRPVSPLRDGGGGGVNESPLQAAAARTAPAGEHSTPGWTPGARTGKRQDPQANTPAWGRCGGVPKRAAKRVCGEGATVTEQTPILTRTLRGRKGSTEAAAEPARWALPRRPGSPTAGAPVVLRAREGRVCSKPVEGGGGVRKPESEIRTVKVN